MDLFFGPDSLVLLSEGETLEETDAKSIIQCVLLFLANSRGVSLSAINKGSCLGRNSISNIANGKANPTLETISKIARFFGMSCGDFIVLGFHIWLESQPRNRKNRLSVLQKNSKREGATKT